MLTLILLSHKNKLHKIYLNRNSTKNFYINHERGVPRFENEKAFAGLNHPDTGFRLLTLYRYWNIINYFFPYTYLTDNDWNTLLKKYIPLFIESKNRLEYEMAVARLITEINDSHGFLFGLVSTNLRTPYLICTIGSTVNPGEFQFLIGRNLVHRPRGETYNGKIVVITNEITQSAAETIVMNLRAGSNTTVIGVPTAGANGNISYISLPGGLRTSISGLGIYYPDKSETQRVGIIPDIEIRPTIQGIREGRDELLEKAIEIIKYYHFLPRCITSI